MSKKRKKKKVLCGDVAPEILRRGFPGALLCQLKHGHPGSHANWKDDGIRRVWMPPAGPFVPNEYPYAANSAEKAKA